jgi:hypothetical protein
VIISLLLWSNKLYPAVRETAPGTHWIGEQSEKMDTKEEKKLFKSTSNKHKVIKEWKSRKREFLKKWR